MKVGACIYMQSRAHTCRKLKYGGTHNNNNYAAMLSLQVASAFCASSQHTYILVSLKLITYYMQQIFYTLHVSRVPVIRKTSLGLGQGQGPGQGQVRIWLGPRS